MLRDTKGISVYMIISIVGLLILAFILILPQVLDIQSKEQTEECLKNMREIENAVLRYMNERHENFIGDTTDLHRMGYVRRPVYVCPSGTPESRYYTEGKYETGEVIVTCPLVDEYPDHVLHPTIE
ncbi:MAG: hypothetical protein K0B81_08825 [Candidatus Cloacimonetes bacterium]|nr:hypothetical protein [Candidatus Cloacimonadota bacterium]